MQQTLLAGAIGLLAACWAAGASGQTCTTQSRMTDAVRTGLASAATELAHDVLGKDAGAVKALTAPEYTASFEPTAFLVRTTGEKIAGDTAEVRELFLLDATARKAGDSTDADFACALSGTQSEVDFSVAGLPPGRYGFAMVEATGSRPWLLSFLLREEGSGWRMAGFYPHPREAAGHNGLWYWTAARDHAKVGQKWLAWTYYGEADRLLRPATFATSSHLDVLLTEQRGSAPGELSDGVSPSTPLVLKGASGGEFHVTALEAEGSEDGKRLNLMLHMAGDPAADPAAARARNLAAATALVASHKELRPAYAAIWVFSETSGTNPVLTQHSMAEIP